LRDGLGKKKLSHRSLQRKIKKHEITFWIDWRVVLGAEEEEGEDAGAGVGDEEVEEEGADAAEAGVEAEVEGADAAEAGAEVEVAGGVVEDDAGEEAIVTDAAGVTTTITVMETGTAEINDLDIKNNLDINRQEINKATHLSKTTPQHLTVRNLISNTDKRPNPRTIKLIPRINNLSIRNNPNQLNLAITELSTNLA